MHAPIVALGLDETDANKQNLEVYRDAFEKPFLAATELFYQAESQRFIGDNSVTEYMKKAEMRLSEEETRVDMYLHATTRTAVRSLSRFCNLADILISSCALTRRTVGSQM